MPSLKKRHLSDRITGTNRRITKLEAETAAAITATARRVDILLDRLEDIRNMVAEVADKPQWKTDATDEEINAGLAEDVADLPEPTWSPKYRGFYGETVREVLGMLPDPRDEDGRMNTGQHASGIIYDDLIGEKTFPYEGQASRVTATEAIEAAKALDKDPDAFEEFVQKVGQDMALRLDAEIRTVFEPTDDDLERVDALLDELFEDHG
jgi:hypothetical protein